MRVQVQKTGYLPLDIAGSEGQRTEYEGEAHIRPSPVVLVDLECSPPMRRRGALDSNFILPA